jgi:hypothetical protein
VIKLRSLAPEGAVASEHLARITHCRFAFGRRRDILQLVAELTPAATRSYALLFRHAGLGETTIKWLAVGRRCEATDALFWRLTGVRPDNAKVECMWAHPADLNSWIRCHLLLEALEADSRLEPDWQSTLEGSEHWRLLCRHWAKVFVTLNRECPSWRDGEGSAPVTLDLIDWMLNQAGMAHESKVAVGVYRVMEVSLECD